MMPVARLGARGSESLEDVAAVVILITVDGDEGPVGRRYRSRMRVPNDLGCLSGSIFFVLRRILVTAT